jgi:type IV pilus assembly protein PilC
MTTAPTLQRKDKLTLISNVATMLGAGIPILEAVDSLLEESKGAMRKVLVILRESLNQGHPLSHGMEKMPRVFDPITINMVKAAEEAGTLETSLKDLAASIRKDIAFTDKLRSSLTYPVFVLVVFVGVFGFILMFVIPRISRVFSGLGTIPTVTKVLIDLSTFVRENYLFLLLGTVAIIVLISWLYRIKRRVVINTLLNMPGLQKLGREIDLANFTRSMGLLLNAGIPVREALRFSESVVIKKEVIKMVQDMRGDVDSGKPISEGMRAHRHVAPSMMIRVTETAEASGTLETSMQDMAVYFESQVSRTLKTMTSLLEPVMLVVMGLLVGGMMLAVIAPMYNLISQVNSR